MKRKHLSAALFVFAVVASLTIGTAAPAVAVSSFRIAWTHIGIYPRSAPSMSASKVGNALPDGASISVQCELTGTSVTSDVATTTIWERLTNGTYLPNAFVDTGVNGWTPGVPRCDAQNPTPVPVSNYNRQAAADWAKSHYKSAYIPFISNCTVFVSGALAAGGIPVTTVWQPWSRDLSAQGSKAVWLYFHNIGPTKRWSSADYLKNYIVNEAKLGTITEISFGTKNPGASIGDLIFYDEAHNKTPGIVDHVAIVTGFASDGTALVTQKQPSQLGRGWNWSLVNNKPFIQADPGSRAYLVHITY